SKDPIVHYVMSWQEGEAPKEAQVEEALSLFLAELGLPEHQVVYGLHADTENYHLHVMLNRVHPDSLQVAPLWNDFDAADRALARIEHAQGWQREERGRYRVQEDGELVREHHEVREQEPSARVCDQERRTQEKSAERI